MDTELLEMLPSNNLNEIFDAKPLTDGCFSWLFTPGMGDRKPYLPVKVYKIKNFLNLNEDNPVEFYTEFNYIDGTFLRADELKENFVNQFGQNIHYLSPFEGDELKEEDVQSEFSILQNYDRNIYNQFVELSKYRNEIKQEYNNKLKIRTAIHKFVVDHGLDDRFGLWMENILCDSNSPDDVRMKR
ncbi:hypothetical protein GEMRC1_000352 [Eukaryota sp. GEM-RC1]